MELCQKRGVSTCFGAKVYAKTCKVVGMGEHITKFNELTDIVIRKVNEFLQNLTTHKLTQACVTKVANYFD